MDEDFEEKKKKAQLLAFVPLQMVKVDFRTFVLLSVDRLPAAASYSGGECEFCVSPCVNS